MCDLCDLAVSIPRRTADGTLARLLAPSGSTRLVQRLRTHAAALRVSAVPRRAHTVVILLVRDGNLYCWC